MAWVLQTERLRCSSASGGRGFPDVCLAPGDELWIDAADVPAEDATVWCDVILGLQAPSEGHIKVAERAWEERSLRDQDALRGLIRCVCHNNVWISNLDIAENITLSERHHTRRATADIMRETETWAHRLGLPGVPEGRPAYAARRVLRQAQWIQAFLGSPLLLLLAVAAAEDGSTDPERLGQAIDEKRDQGVAVVWFGCNPAGPIVRQGVDQTPRRISGNGSTV